MIFRAPSVKTLMRLHWINHDTAIELRRLMKAPIESLPGYHPSHALMERMDQLDALAKTHGVEALRTRKNDYEYLNTGHTYCPTIVADLVKQRFFVCDWGTLVEQEGTIDDDC